MPCNWHYYVSFGAGVHCRCSCCGLLPDVRVSLLWTLLQLWGGPFRWNVFWPSSAPLKLSLAVIEKRCPEFTKWPATELRRKKNNTIPQHIFSVLLSFPAFCVIRFLRKGDSKWGKDSSRRRLGRRGRVGQAGVGNNTRNPHRCKISWMLWSKRQKSGLLAPRRTLSRAGCRWVMEQNNRKGYSANLMQSG